MRRTLFACWTAFLAGLVLLEPALAGNGGIAPPEPASPSAESIRELYWVLLGIGGAIFVLVEAALILFIVRYRGRGRPRTAEGPQLSGNTRLELIWTAIPVLILIVLGAVVFYKLPGIENTPDANAAGDKIRIRVEGRQFYWRYVYPTGRVSINELRVPVGRVIELEFTAPAHDVIHSWWVPELTGKKDAIPGESTDLWFEAREEGVYRGQCGEYCGAQHALMTASVRAVPQAEYDRWLGVASPDLGEELFAGACAPCHGNQAEGLIGPPLRSPDAELVENAVRNGRGAMPPVGKGWTEREMRALIRHLEQMEDDGGS